VASGDGPHLSEGTLAGWRALTMENEDIRVTVLPDKGAELHALVHAPSNTGMLFEAPWGLPAPGAPRLPGSGDEPFMWHYAGGWQELFPSAGDACTYQGRSIPLHGEVAASRWQVVAVENEPDTVALTVAVTCRQTPFRLERRMRIERGSPRLVLDESVTNLSPEVAEFVWGHHAALGPPFLEAGCRLELPASRIVTLPVPFEETARLEPGQAATWPLAERRGGGTVDLRQIPGADERSHDDIYVTGLREGWLAVENPRLGLVFRLDFDHTLFRWVTVWQAFGGADEPPLTGSYALGVEPWTSRHSLADALAAGEAVALAGGETLRTTLVVSLLASSETAR
jgi:hypothetical protein